MLIARIFCSKYVYFYKYKEVRILETVYRKFYIFEHLLFIDDFQTSKAFLNKVQVGYDL